MAQVIWDENASLEQLATQTERVYYTCNRGTFHDFPESLLDSCWSCLSRDAFDEHALLVLVNVHRARWELQPDARTGCAIKRLIDASSLSANPYPSRLGNALIESSWLQDGYRRISGGRPLDLSSMTDDPGALIEEAFPRVGLAPHDYLVAALLMAGYRGLAMGADELRVHATLYAFREARYFFLGSKPDIAMESVEWAERRMLDDDAFNARIRVDIGKMYLELAQCERVTNGSRAQLELLSRAQALLEDSPDSLSQAYFWQGEILCQQGDLYHALLNYDRALGCRPTDREFNEIILLQRESVLAQGEGRLLEIADNAVFLAEKRAGMDRFPWDDMRRLYNSMREGMPTIDLAKIVAPKLKSAIDEMARDGWMDDKYVLAFYLTWLKTALMAGESPLALASALTDARRYESAAPQETVLQFRLLRTHLMRQFPAPLSAQDFPDI